TSPKSSRNPPYQTRAPPRSPYIWLRAPDAPGRNGSGLPTFPSGASKYEADKRVGKKILGLGGATPGDSHRGGPGTPRPGPREAACQAGVLGKRSGSEGGGRAGRGAGGSVRTSRSKTRRIKSAHFQSRGFSGGFASFASPGF